MADEDLRSQYVELNSRSRWYASQAWQIPFAYIGLSALIVAPFAKERLYLGVVLIMVAVFGIPVVIHLFGIFERIEKTVQGMNGVEEKLQLPVRAENKCIIHGSMLVLLILVLLISLVVGILLTYSELCVGR